MRTDPFKRGRVAGSDAKDLRARKGQNCASGERDCAHHEFADVVRERVSVPDRSEERVPSALGQSTDRLWSVDVLVLAVLRGGEGTDCDLWSVEERLVERGQSSCAATFADRVPDGRGSLGGVLVRDTRHARGV